MSEDDIKRVMDEHGFDYLQARNHLKCRQILTGSLRIARVPVTPFLTVREGAGASVRPHGPAVRITSCLVIADPTDGP